MSIADRVAIVTGGGSGLGRAMALGLARDGANVLIAEVREAAGKKVLEEIRSRSGTGELFIGDLSQVERAKEMVALCVERFQQIDILIHSAGLRMEEHEDGVFEPW